MNEPRKLPQTYKVTGLVLNLVKRNEKVAMYAGNDGVPYYQVFKIRIAKPSSRQFSNGEIIEYPLREIIPGNEDFGKWAWCIRQRDRAEKRYEELSK